MIAPLWLACTTVVERPVETERFPHPEEFETATAHGALVAEVGLDSCQECHADSSAPTCVSCHAEYPHALGWIAEHGPESMQDAACESCHAVEGLGATEGYACDSCHSSYPHDETWTAKHGAHALALPSIEAGCGGCHGEELDGGSSEVACDSCHASWPHGDDFIHPPAWRADPQGCAGCHATAGAWTGGSAGVACSRCHASYPHEPSWSHGHMAVASQVGEATCLGCHDAGDGDSTMPATCASTCHGEQP